MSEINRINNRIESYEKESINQSQKNDSNSNSTFDEMLKKTAGQYNLCISKHASIRMQNRNIELNDNQVRRLSIGLDKAKEKCIKDTLVLIDDKAFVVNVKSNTVITAVEDKDMKNRVFTNIDGAVIV